MKDKESYCVSILKTFAEPVRVRIIEVLEKGELSVSGIWDLLQMQQSNTSRHLSWMMNHNGLLVSRRDGHKTLYDLKHKEQVFALLAAARRNPLPVSYIEAFRVLGQVSRIKIVELLRDGEMPLGDLIQKVGGEKTNMAHHLALMVDSGMLTGRRDESRRSFYKLANANYVLSLVDHVSQLFAQEVLFQTMQLNAA